MASNGLKSVVQGSYHQGDERFGDSAGKQCTCCALFSVIFTLMKSPGHWNFNDLDFIVEKGDSIYKNLNVNRYLMFSELPRETSIFNSIITINYMQNI